MDKIISVALVAAFALAFTFALSPLSTDVEAAHRGKHHRIVRGGGCQTLSSSSLQQKASPYGESIASASSKYGVSKNLIKAVITIESCFKPNAHGSSGEKGLMQLMPGTARRYNISNGYNSWQSIHGGARYLGNLLSRYDGNIQRAVAAYNAGEGNVSKGGRIPNRGYVNKVMHAYSKFSSGKETVYTPTQASIQEAPVAPVTVRAAVARPADIHAMRPLKTALHQPLTAKVKKARATLAAPQLAAAADGILPWSDLPVHSAASSRNAGAAHYVVNAGDTVFEVMRRTGVPVNTIIGLNHLPAPHGIKAGQVLRLR
jgi:hypothetical protein